MNTEHIERLKALPQRESEIWQGGIFRIPTLGAETGPIGNSLFVPLWAAMHDQKVHTGELQMVEPRDSEGALWALVEFALESEWGGYRPGSVEVLDADLAEQLGFLGEVGIEVRLVERLEAIEEVMESLGQHFSDFEEDLPHVPGALDGRGVTVERMRCFAEGAAEFYKAMPWQYLTDSDLIRIEAPKAPDGMKYAVLLGAGRSVFGMGFYRTVKDYVAFRGFTEGGEPPESVWQVTFDSIDDLPREDAELWRQEGLPWASEKAYPFVIRIGRDGEMKRPTAKQLAFLEGVLRAWAATNEEEIDSGRWQKKVCTIDGEVEYTLSLPDLLKPPSHHEWMRRGFEPDRRAHERMFADMGRYFDQNPVADMDEMNEVMGRLFAGRRFDESVTEAETPMERAQELCYEAFDTHGRRRVQLAREALKICPDCADAYVILAEQAGTREAELENYTKATEAAERALGAEAFEEHVGHFWGVTETRPYMRAREGLAQALQELGRLDEAADHFQAMLKLNPDDNQGVRYSLMPLLLQLNRDVEAARLLKEYTEETANWAYAQALLAFRLSGRSTSARRELRTAFRNNPHVPDLLLTGYVPPPPPHYTLGSPEEAICCVEELRDAFVETKGAMAWLAAEHHQRLKDQETRQKALRQKQRKKRKRKKR